MKDSSRFSAVMAATLVALIAAGCEDARGGAPDEPVEGALVFDAAMLDREDAGPIAPPRADAGPGGRDAGRVTPRDAGPVPGFDAGPRTRTCRGFARSCSLISRYSCSSQLGCRTGGDCGGVSRSCYSIYSSYSCRQQEGCRWSSYDSDCSGSAWSCNLFSSEFSCEDQEGCRWDEECEGVSTACSLLGEYDCLRQDGCYLD